MTTPKFISDELVYAIGSTLIHSLWQAAAIGLILVVILKLVPKKSAQLKYWLAITALVGIVYWTGYTLKEQLAPLLTETPVSTEVALQAWQIAPGLQDVGVYKLPLMQEYLFKVVTKVQPYMPALVVFWVLGMLIFLVRLQGSMMYLSKLRNTNVFPVSREWQAKVKQLSQQLGLRKSVILFESGLAEIPMVIGHLKPLILLPVGMLSGLPVRDIEAVIAHELAHVKRYDYLINIAQTLIESVLFFNPVVWWVCYVIRKQREHCCDDMAVTCCGNQMIYAHALTNLGAWSLRTPVMSMGLFRSKGELFSRIKRLVYPQSTGSVKEKLVPALVLLLTLSCFSWYSLKVQAKLAPKNPGPLEAYLSPSLDIIPQLQAYEPSAPLQLQDTVPQNEETEELPPMEPREEVTETIKMERKEGELPIPMDFDSEEFSDIMGVIPELFELPPIPAIADIMADVEVFVDVDVPEIFMDIDVMTDMENLRFYLNDTTRKKIEEALESQKEALERARFEQSKALERARTQLRESLKSDRPEELTEAEWEEAKEQIRKAERKLERVMEDNERTLQRALSEREHSVEARREHIERIHRDHERQLRDRLRHTKRMELERADRLQRHGERRHQHQRRNNILREVLVEDGLISSHDADLHLIFKKDIIKINGKKLTGTQKEKYRKLLDEIYGPDSSGELEDTY